MHSVYLHVKRNRIETGTNERSNNGGEGVGRFEQLHQLNIKRERYICIMLLNKPGESTLCNCART